MCHLHQQSSLESSVEPSKSWCVTGKKPAEIFKRLSGHEGRVVVRNGEEGSYWPSVVRRVLSAIHRSILH